MDIERLHTVVQHLGSECVGSDSWGYTTAITYLLLGEAQCGDKGNCYVYVTADTISAETTRERFRQLVSRVEGFGSTLRSDTHVHIPDTDQDFFFVDLEFFNKTYAFGGIRVHRLFVDMPLTTRQAAGSVFTDKVGYLVSRGTDLL